MAVTLAIDTSAATSVALLKDGQLVAELNSQDKMGHAETVGAAIASVLEQSGMRGTEVTEVVVGRGPGPFTGLRVGIAAAVLFAEGAQAQLSGLVSLDAIAIQALKQQAASYARPLLVTADARRSEVYWALYSGLDEHGVPVRIDGPNVNKPAELAEQLEARMIEPSKTDAVVTGAALGELAEALRSAGALDADVTALYLRAPDAVEPKAAGVFGKKVS